MHPLKTMNVYEERDFYVQQVLYNKSLRLTLVLNYMAVVNSLKQLQDQFITLDQETKILTNNTWQPVLHNDLEGIWEEIGESVKGLPKLDYYMFQTDQDQNLWYAYDTCDPHKIVFKSIKTT